MKNHAPIVGECVVALQIIRDELLSIRNSLNYQKVLQDVLADTVLAYVQLRINVFIETLDQLNGAANKRWEYIILSQVMRPAIKYLRRAAEEFSDIRNNSIAHSYINHKGNRFLVVNKYFSIYEIACLIDIIDLLTEKMRLLFQIDVEKYGSQIADQTINTPTKKLGAQNERQRQFFLRELNEKIKDNFSRLESDQQDKIRICFNKV